MCWLGVGGGLGGLRDVCARVGYARRDGTGEGLSGIDVGEGLSGFDWGEVVGAV